MWIGCGGGVLPKAAMASGMEEKDAEVPLVVAIVCSSVEAYAYGYIYIYVYVNLLHDRFVCEADQCEKVYLMA